MAKSIHFAILLFFCTLNLPSSQSSINFTYTAFHNSDIELEGATLIKPSGALKLTNRSRAAIGHAFYPYPIPMLKHSNSSSAPEASSFSTTFVFAIIRSPGREGGYGFVFSLSPSKGFPDPEGEHYLGVLNRQNDRNSSNHIFMVEFDTVNGFNERSDKNGNHVGININSMDSVASEPAYYYALKHNNTRKKEELMLESDSAHPIQAWVDYDGVEKIVNVTIAPAGEPKPSLPLISHPVDLTKVMKDVMYAGFSASTGVEKSSSHYILGWSFTLDGVATPLDISQLPLPPPTGHSPSMKFPVRKALIATFSVVLFLLIAALIAVFAYKRMRHFEVLEDWELDCPHRFRYRDLYIATKGFKNSELIGVGGFGEVYKGLIPTTGAEVAVKKISNRSLQGIREFAAEIESLGRLRHKHLVNLQGWCKQKNDLLLIYDYVPNGSLDSLLYNSKKKIVLTWEQRSKIIQGIAAGLLYLHEEWEQVVIHRDVKSSNVLIDREMNGRLGDFGLARLYDHGKNSHTTNVVGTIGYIAPELTRTGKASTSTDIFAYGILLLEVVCGRAPIDYEPERGQVILVDWVVECFQLDQILDVVDPKLNSMFVVEEVELVLRLGLLCSHPRPEARPSMREVVRYLNGEASLTLSDKLSSAGSRRAFESQPDFFELISSDAIASSYVSSSTGRMSSNSFDTGR